MTAERLRNLIDYDYETGSFTWRVTRGHHARAGRPIGHQPDGAGRTEVIIEGKIYRLHRLAWLYVHGELPPKGIWIDHIDGDPQNNRIANLRLATPLQNGHNKKKMRRNTSGYKGVTFNKKRGKYVAMIMVDGKHHYLGAFVEAHSAHDAYCKAAHELHGEFARTE